MVVRDAGGDGQPESRAAIPGPAAAVELLGHEPDFVRRIPPPLSLTSSTTSARSRSPLTQRVFAPRVADHVVHQVVEHQGEPGPVPGTGGSVAGIWTGPETRRGELPAKRSNDSDQDRQGDWFQRRPGRPVVGDR